MRRGAACTRRRLVVVVGACDSEMAQAKYEERVANYLCNTVWRRRFLAEMAIASALA